jgi:predicted nucleic acid-binding protein
MKCFVDTGAFAALYDKRDGFHGQAKAVWASLRAQRAVLYTSRDVIGETVILLRRRANHAVAVTCGNDLWNSPVLDVQRGDPRQDREAWRLFAKHADKELSFVDCLSFVLMRGLGLRHAFTFDGNFAQLGFEPLRP